jgi:hypothetical protein
MTRSAGPLFACALAVVSAQANAQAGATPPAAAHQEADQPAMAIEPRLQAANPPTADDICRTLEQAAAENGLAVEFFARVIWQESRFNRRSIRSDRGAASFGGFLRELRDRFGNLGLAAAAYNAGPARVSAWLTSQRPLPDETRNYVAIVTGWTADEWASGSPPQTADTTIPQGVPCTRLANLILAPKEEAKSIATYALGDMACSSFSGEQGLGTVP